MTHLLASRHHIAARSAALCIAALAAISLAYVAAAQDADGQDRPGEGPAGAASVEFTPAEKAWLAAHQLIRVGA